MVSEKVTMSEASLIQKGQIKEVKQILDECNVTRFGDVEPSKSKSGVVITLYQYDNQYLSDVNIGKFLQNGYVVTEVHTTNKLIEEDSVEVARACVEVTVDELNTGYK